MEYLKLFFLLKNIIDLGADIYQQLRGGFSILHYAVQSGNVNLFYYILLRAVEIPFSQTPRDSVLYDEIQIDEMEHKYWSERCESSLWKCLFINYIALRPPIIHVVNFRKDKVYDGKYVGIFKNYPNVLAHISTFSSPISRRLITYLTDCTVL